MKRFLPALPTSLPLPALALALAFLVGCAAPVSWKGEAVDASSGILAREFIVDQPPFPESHASTLVETGDGVAAAWFGGTRERHPDVCIWFSRFDGSRWSAPAKVADGVEPDGKTRYPCWNPVLFQPPHSPLMLFYKVGPSPSEWWGMLKTSRDGGITWTKGQRLPGGQYGPVRNKPVLLPDGSLLCPSSSEVDGWTIHLERTADGGATWERTSPLNRKEEFGAIQPTILPWPDGRMQLLNRSRQHVVTECWREGESWHRWSSMRPTALPNPNSGIDGLVLKDGRGLLVFNDSDQHRSPISIALSADGREWHSALVLEAVSDGELSYPAVIQTRDGLVHISYTWKRQKVRHLVIDPSRLH